MKEERAKPFSPDLEAFIADVVDSVELLDVLALLADRPDHWFAPLAIAQALATSPSSVQRRLQRLEDKGLVRGEDQYYSYAPQAERARLVADLLVAYRSHRVRVIERVFGMHTSGEDGA